MKTSNKGKEAKSSKRIMLLCGISGLLLILLLILFSAGKSGNESTAKEAVGRCIASMADKGGISGLTSEQLNSITEAAADILAKELEKNSSEQNTEKLYGILKEKLKQYEFLTEKDVNVLLKGLERLIEGHYIKTVDAKAQHDGLQENIIALDNALKQKAECETITQLSVEIKKINGTMSDKLHELRSDADKNLENAEKELLVQLESIKNNVEKNDITVQEKITAVTKIFNEYMNNIVKVLEDTKIQFQTLLNEQAAETTEKIEQIKNELTESQREKVSALEKKMEDMKAEYDAILNDKIDTVNQSMEKAIADLQAALLIQEERTTIKFDEYYLFLNEKVTEIHSHINQMKQDLNVRIIEMENELVNKIDQLSNLLNEKTIEAEQRLEQIRNDFESQLSDQNGDMETKLENFRIAYEGLLELNIRNLNDKFAEYRKQIEAQFADVISETDRKDLSIKNSLTELIADETGKVSEAVKENTDQIAEISGKAKENTERIAQADRKADENSKAIQEVSGKISAAETNLNHLTERMTNNEAGLSDVSSRISECFQYVSSGKTKLASTLTDKGINTAADASFEIIDNNIRDLYAKAFQYGADSVSGAATDVVYSYHNHEDGCYSTCPGTLRYKYTIEHKPYKDKYFVCDVCNRAWVTAGQNEYNDRPCGDKKCTCGMVDGQIISATVVFR